MIHQLQQTPWNIRTHETGVVHFGVSVSQSHLDSFDWFRQAQLRRRVAHRRFLVVGWCHEDTLAVIDGAPTLAPVTCTWCLRRMARAERGQKQFTRSLAEVHGSLILEVDALEWADGVEPAFGTLDIDDPLYGTIWWVRGMLRREAIRAATDEDEEKVRLVIGQMRDWLIGEVMRRGIDGSAA